MSQAHAVTDTTFEAEVLGSDIPVLVDFWAEWCGPCKTIGPAIDAIAASKAVILKVAKVNIDENPRTPAGYGVRGIPALMIIKNGEVIASRVGAAPASVLEKWVADTIG